VTLLPAACGAWWRRCGGWSHRKRCLREIPCGHRQRCRHSSTSLSCMPGWPTLRSSRGGRQSLPRHHVYICHRATGCAPPPSMEDVDTTRERITMRHHQIHPDCHSYARHHTHRPSLRDPPASPDEACKVDLAVPVHRSQPPRLYGARPSLHTVAHRRCTSPHPGLTRNSATAPKHNDPKG
jgi:hypothetical protein